MGTGRVRDGVDVAAKMAGNRLAALRKAARVSQRELSRLSGIHIQTLWKCEAGLHLPSAETMVRIALSLSISIDQLVRYTRPHLFGIGVEVPRLPRVRPKRLVPLPDETPLPTSSTPTHEGETTSDGACGVQG